MSGNLRDGPSRRARTGADPQGKAALFTATGAPRVRAGEPVPGAPGTGAPRVGADATAAAPRPAPGATVVVECSQCGTSTSLAYRELVLANLPVAVWLPPIGVRFNHRLRCPACGRRTWTSVRWW